MRAIRLGAGKGRDYGSYRLLELFLVGWILGICTVGLWWGLWESLVKAIIVYCFSGAL